ncbi:MAG TPA: effector-associated domain EAD1-containing protein [Solirubrobacter sp.]|nr:effector-associated domain EAD1-containing protein [Solirubrobacter sp.]
MANPFFSAAGYPWGREDAVALHHALAQAVPDAGQAALLYQQAGGAIEHLNTAQAPADVWRDALDALSRAAGLRRLCELVRADQRFAAVRGAIDAVFTATSDVELSLLDNDVLVLDRTNLRSCLALLDAADSPVRVLIVRGRTKTGKSRGRYLFDRAARQRGARSLYLFAGIITTVDDVVAQLFSALSALDRIPARGTTTDDAWYQAVCLQLQTVAAERGQPLWVAIDDLGTDDDGAPLLDPEIRRFCEHVALNTRNPFFAAWVRLMLIHYPDGAVPTRWEPEFWREDRTDHADVQQPHVEAFLRAWATARRRTLLDGEIVTLARDVIAAADADGPAPRLRRLDEALTAALRELERT